MTSELAVVESFGRDWEEDNSVVRLDNNLGGRLSMGLGEVVTDEVTSGMVLGKGVQNSGGC